MTHDTTATDAPVPTDRIDHPADLLDRDDVDVEDVPGVQVHEHHFDLYDTVEAMAVVGVTDADGRVLLERPGSASVAVLPHAEVEADEDTATAAAAGVEAATGVPVDVDGVVGLRRQRYTPAEDDDSETTAYQVFLAASPAGDPTVPDGDGDDRTVGWYDEIPVDPADQDDTLAADIRRFLD